ncbi:serine/threonine-protein kinase pdik1l-like [Amphiura filiformis]|uniref:serine/threonine-protein kinase pdik1l-like n=1 Tax=Amphiura filiformis TaxID=82378 RepID=UPI003B20DA1B
MAVSVGGYAPLQEIGKGAYGAVYKTKNLQTKKQCALKRIELNIAGEREVKALLKVGKHPLIVEYRKSFRRRNYIWIEMEFYNGGNLNAHFWTQRPNILQKHNIMEQIAQAVAYLHQSRVIHRDLKPDNILISYQNSDLCIKIADFGLAKAILSSQFSGDIQQFFMSSQCGTEYFRAPEVLDGRYTLKADIFSMGVVFAALMKGTSLSKVKSRYLAAYVQCDGKELPIGRYQHDKRRDVSLPARVDMSKTLPQLIKSMIRLDDSLRPTADEVASILQGIPEDELQELHEHMESWQSKDPRLQQLIQVFCIWLVLAFIGGYFILGVSLWTLLVFFIYLCFCFYVLVELFGHLRATI